MTSVRDVAVLPGSLISRGQTLRRVAKLERLAPAGLALRRVPFGDLPLYNRELDNPSPPPTWTVFCRSVARADAVLFVTPEYNRSVPGGLKNAIDVGSRPYGASVWSGKSAVIVTHSPGAIGGFGANHHLRQGLVFLDMPVLRQPEAYIGTYSGGFGDDGEIVDSPLVKLLTQVLTAFADLVERTVLNIVAAA